MSLLEVAEILGIGLVLNILVTLLVIRAVLVHYNLNQLIAMGRRFMGSMGQKGQATQAHNRQVKENAATKQKLAEGLMGELPFGDVIQRVMAKKGISGDQIFGLMQDQDFIKGVMVLINLGKGLVGKISDKDGKQEGGAITEGVPY